MSNNIIVEIRKYLETDITPMEQAYFQSKIEIFNKAPTETDDKTKKALAVFINKNEKLFKNTGQFNKLWPELSFLAD